MDITNLTGFEKPLTKLVEVVAQGIGTLAAPSATLRQANADAKARIIHAQADIEIAELWDRTERRLKYREQLRQENIESVVAGAAKELPSAVNQEPVDPDWTLQFFDSAQDVCDKDMQSLWAKVLAGEVGSPGTYAKRTLQFLKSMDKSDAQLFTDLCSFAFRLENGWHFLFDDAVLRSFLRKRSETAYIAHFSAIGLLTPEVMTWAASDIVAIRVSHFDQKFVLHGPPKAPELPIPVLDDFVYHRYFSQIGHQLASICAAKPDPAYTSQLAAFHLKENKVDFSVELAPPPATSVA